MYTWLASGVQSTKAVSECMSCKEEVGEIEERKEMWMEKLLKMGEQTNKNIAMLCRRVDISLERVEDELGEMKKVWRE